MGPRSSLGDSPRHSESTLVAAIVGIDGCGKSSTFRGAAARLAQSVPIAGLGETVLGGSPSEQLGERTDIPLSRSARVVGAAAKGLRRPGLYKDLKILEFLERNHIRSYLLTHDAPDALLTDGDPLVNMSAWAASRYASEELADDDRLFDATQYLAGMRRVPARDVRHYARRAWPLVVLNRLHLTRFAIPDVVFLLEIAPAKALARIRARGRELQAHENEAFLTELAVGYERVCALLEARLHIPVIRIRVDDLSLDEVTQRVAAELLAIHRQRRIARAPGPASPDTIEVVATTISGSFEDQRKVERIEPEFCATTQRPVRLHQTHTHAEARAVAHDLVLGGGRIIVSAGGAGTFNAVLEGCHIDGAVPPDLRLAFLRKGSADLIGKALHVPDDLSAAAAAIAEAIDADRCVEADVLSVEATEPDATVQRMHMVGFGGLGVFGDVPRFTETRAVKYYKGLLGTLLGDLGPFYVGLVLAALWWWVRRLFARIPPLRLTLDGDPLPVRQWVAVIVLNGDLGKDFPLGRRLDLGSGTFRVVALPYRGVRAMVRQLAACRSAAVLEDPEAVGAIVREISTLIADPVTAGPAAMVNVDGLRLVSAGTVRVTVSGRVRLLAARAEDDRRPVSSDESSLWTPSSIS